MQPGAKMLFEENGGGGFASWYPRWGSGDLVLALNGLYNAGVDAPHDGTLDTWIDLVGGRSLTGVGDSPIWGPTSYECDSVNRILVMDVDFSDVPGFTFSVFGYFGMSWGDLVATYDHNGGGVFNIMPNGSYIGAWFQFAKTNADDFAQYHLDYKPSLTEFCVTCDSSGFFSVYENGSPVYSDNVGLDGFAAIRDTRSIYIGGASGHVYVPPDSSLYGLTVYRAVLDASEIARLHAANVKNLIGGA